MTIPMSSTCISVVIIFLNGEAFLQEAIDSIYLQTHSDWELLLVDDGSMDGSPLIAQRATHTDPHRVRYIQHADHANHGTSASRNLGASLARGDYFLFLDCDDVLLPNNFARHAAILDVQADLAAVFSPTLFWLWDRAYAEDTDSLQSVAEFGDQRIVPPALLLAMLRDESLHPANCGTMFRREAFESCGGFDMSFRGMYEDSALLTKLLMNHPSYMISECLSAYRVHRASQCNAARESGQYDTTAPNPSRSKFLHWARDYVVHRSEPGAAILLALDRELSAYQALPNAATSRLSSLAARMKRRLQKLRHLGARGDSLDPVLQVMQSLRSTYLAMHREEAAAALGARIAELSSR